MTSNPVIGGRWHNQKRHLVHQRAGINRQLWSTFSITPPPVHWGVWQVADLGGTPPGRCVYSDKSLNLYEPQFSQLENGEGDVGC